MVLDIAPAGAKYNHPRVVAAVRYLWQMSGTFLSAEGGTFVSDTGGTFIPILSNYTRSAEFKALYKKDEDKAFEVAQYIRAILKTASLLHDIGNPPFGHFGEDTIKDYFVNIFMPGGHNISEIELDKEEKIVFTQFDSNALGFRIVSKLQYAGRLDGLNLTYGTLGAYLKYPNEDISEKTPMTIKHMWVNISMESLKQSVNYTIKSSKSVIWRQKTKLSSAIL